MNIFSIILLFTISLNIQSEEYSIDTLFKDYNPIFHETDDFFLSLGETDLPAEAYGVSEEYEDNQTRNYRDLSENEKIYLQRISDTLVYDYTNASDKHLHFNAGYIVGSVSSELCSPIYKKQTNRSRRLRFWCSFTAATVAGVAKEFYDSTGRGNVEATDALATSLGGFQLEIKF